MEKQLLELIGFVKSVSPMVWDSFIYQQWLTACTTILVALLCVLVLVFGLFVLKTRPKWALESDFNENFGGVIISVTGGLLTLIFVPLCILDSVPRLINPAYYAIRALLALGGVK